jgi:hypothetical protein
MTCRKKKLKGVLNSHTFRMTRPGRKGVKSPLYGIFFAANRLRPCLFRGISQFARALHDGFTLSTVLHAVVLSKVGEFNIYGQGPRHAEIPHGSLRKAKRQGKLPAEHHGVKKCAGDRYFNDRNGIRGAVTPQGVSDSSPDWTPLLESRDPFPGH